MNITELANLYMFCERNNFVESAKKLRAIIDKMINTLDTEVTDAVEKK
jgi:hypothetical protein